MNRLSKSRLFVLLLGLLVLWGWGTAVFAQTIVEPLPDNNLIQNPWFRDGNRPSLAGWTDAAGSNAIWSLSQKPSNPSPDQVIGTSARLAFGSGQGGGVGQGGIDAYLYQVVPADPGLTHLQFKIHWVTQWIDRASVTIYGSSSADGPWTAVWVPLDVTQSTSTGGAWTQTELLDTTIAEGFAFYKIELFGRYPDGRQQGAKYTGVYFAVDGNTGEVVELAPPAPTETIPATELEPTSRPVRQTAVPATSTPLPTEVAEETAELGNADLVPAAADTAEATEPTARPARPTRTAPASDAPDTAVVANNAANDSISTIYLVIIGILLLLVIVLGVGWARSVRR